ncbi:MAG: helix-turn-helix transcriptional regulator [Ruminococcus sp.]|jgi:transcriptional regulator with XRE-family HTH domain|nr:helix-turn-helix transcriptional regulator [Ruminococcus sp.]
MFKLKAEDGSNNITGRRLAMLRNERNLSQRKLAKLMQLAGYDVDHHFIRRIENGERFVTDMELVALSKVLNVSIADLIDDTIVVSASEIN